MYRARIAGAAALVAAAFLAGSLTVTRAGTDQPQHYRVEAGETWRSIAVQLGVDEQALACANRTNPTSCPSVTALAGTGREIHVPNVPATTTTTAAATTTAVSVTTAPTTTMDMGTTTSSPPPPGALFTEAFATADGLNGLAFQIEPPAPPPDALSFNGDHALNADGSCGSADTTRQLHEDHTLATHVYFCNAHFMTAMDTPAYVTIAFTPRDANGPIIFPATANQLCLDRDLADLGGRKWIEISVIGSSHFAANGTLIYQNPIFNGNITTHAASLAGDDFQFRDLRNGTEYFVGQNETYQNFVGSVAPSSDKMNRYQECIRDNGNGTVTRILHGPTITDIQTGSGAFPAGPRVFIIADVTYDADKDQGARVANPYTWHWDNIAVAAS